ncbi:MAG: glycosyltransferase family 9 protein [Spirochaetia bacterium]|nr:glycosyltransferase family 9 protein [Spirochaetia bacterium]
MKKLKLSENPKILIVRNDGLGDFILTLPLISALKNNFRKSKIYVLVNKNIENLVPVLSDIDGCIIDEGILLKRHRNLFNKSEQERKKKELLEIIKKHNFNLAVLPYAEKESAKIIYQAKIPFRAGTGRRVFSWRFNVKLWQGRKKSNLPEYKLNMAYLKKINIKENYAAPKIKLISDKKIKANKKTIIMHPYKRNSTALSWPVESFKNLAEILIKSGYKITIIGDKEDEIFLKKQFKPGKNLSIHTSLSLQGLSYLISQSRLFIGNSSGPLHLSALVKIAHIGFFPQNKASSRVRWQTLPLSKKDDYQKFLLSSAFDKNCVNCEREKCRYFNCTASISVEDALAACRHQKISFKNSKKQS